MVANQDTELRVHSARVMELDYEVGLGTATPYAVNTDAMTVHRLPTSDEGTTTLQPSATAESPQAAYEGAQSPLPLDLSTGTTTTTTTPSFATPSSSLTSTPSPPSPIEPTSLDLWNAARESLNSPQYFYTTISANILFKRLVPSESEVFTIRNHNLILSIEQLISDFRTQLRGCLVWRDEEALMDVWKRLLEAKEEMEMLEQPEREGKVRGH